jgi:GT2 family glycosyltransferase
MAVNKQPRVSVIIPTYRRDEPLILTLACFLLQEYPRDRFEIIVVDQSEKHSRKVERRLQAWHDDGDIQWFRPPEIDFASTTRARNWGIAHANNPDIIVFTDDDVELRPDFIEFHVAAYQDASVGAVAGKVIVPTHTYDLDATTIGRITWFGNFVNNFHLDVPAEVDNVIGCNFSLRTSILKEAGLFDVRFRGNAMREETDWAVRVREAGYSIRYEPYTGLLHHMVATGGSRAEEGRLRWYKDLFYNNFLFYRKHAPAWRMPFFVLHMWRPILACWLWYGKGRPAAFLAPWQGIAGGIRAAKDALSKGDAVVSNPKVRVF